MKRLSKVEQFLISSVDSSKYTTYRCDEHGVYQLRKDVDNGLCPRCKKKHEPFKVEQEEQK